MGSDDREYFKILAVVLVWATGIRNHFFCIQNHNTRVTPGGFESRVDAEKDPRVVNESTKDQFYFNYPPFLSRITNIFIFFLGLLFDSGKEALLFSFIYIYISRFRSAEKYSWNQIVFLTKDFLFVPFSLASTIL